MAISLLAVGDMHLGRRPSRLPPWLANQADLLTPIGAWERCVDYALDQHVDLVVFAGDLVDQEDNFFEAYRPLERGIRRLVEAGIEVFGVSGNHDVKVLPRLAEQLTHFQLLGKNGHWQSRSFSQGRDGVTIHGWSFPKPVVTDSPLAGHRFQKGPGVNLGLLHCDLDQTSSNHAPVPSASLKDAGLDGWLLGHVHKPSTLSPTHPTGYLGSLSGLHVGEQGPRGPWLIEIDNDQIQSLTQWKIAPLHWAELALDIESLQDPQLAQDLLLGELKQLDHDLRQHELPPTAVGVRLRLTGQSDLGGQVIETLEANLGENLATGEIASVFIESIIDETRTAVDLEYWASQPNHAGQLASSLLVLDGAPENPARQRLIASAREQLSAVSTDARWGLNEQVQWNDERVCDYLRRSGHRLLAEFIEQLEGELP